MSQIVIHEKHSLILEFLRGVNGIQGDPITIDYKYIEYAHRLLFILCQR